MFRSWALTSASAWRKKGKHESFFLQTRNWQGRTRTMKKLSAFVRSRLESQQSETGNHLDPNLLLAFAERSVSRREHTEILTHLAECPACREVLALSSGVSAGEAPPSPVLAKRGPIWLRWSVAATAVLICSLIVIVWRPSLFESLPKATSSSKPITTERSASSVPAPLISKTIEPDTANWKMRAHKKKQAPAAPDATEFAEGLPHSSLTSSSNTAERSSEPFAMTAQQAIVQAPPPNAGVAPAPSSMPRQLYRLTTVSCRSRCFRLLALQLPSEPSCALNGITKRASGAWKHRREVARCRNLPMAAGRGARFPWTRRPRCMRCQPTGSDVWVGGADGKLFHSVDDGAHWAAIPIADESTRFTGVIIGIDTRGDNITVRTDSRATWTTDDGGAHWRRE